MPVPDLGQALLEQERGLLHPLEEAGRQHHVEHRVAGRHGERVAAEGRAVGARRHALGGLGGGEAGAERKAAAEPFGQRYDVGRDAGLLVGEQVAGAADAGLHLVEDQEQAVLVADLPQGFQERDRRQAHAAFACIGSIRMAAVSGPTSRRTAAASSRARWTKPSTTGPKPSRCFFCPPAARVASVRPWNAPSKAMMRKRSGAPLAEWNLRAVLIAPSIASAPELAKNTTSAKLSRHNRSASRSPSGMR